MFAQPFYTSRQTASVNQVGTCKTLHKLFINLYLQSSTSQAQIVPQPTGPSWKWDKKEGGHLHFESASTMLLHAHTHTREWCFFIFDLFHPQLIRTNVRLRLRVHLMVQPNVLVPTGGSPSLLIPLTHQPIKELRAAYHHLASSAYWWAIRLPTVQS